jgi:hypothetical protein
MITDDYCSPVITRCLFVNNWSSRHGGGLWSDNSWPGPTFCSCTFYGNAAGWLGGGVSLCDGSSAVFDNTIVSFSTSGEGIFVAGGSEATFRCCDIYGNAGGDWVGVIAGQLGIDGNFSACPSFCRAEIGNFHLCDESPCLPGNHPDGYDCGLIGAAGEGCSCGPTRTGVTTWGVIKSMYK